MAEVGKPSALDLCRGSSQLHEEERQRVWLRSAERQVAPKRVEAGYWGGKSADYFAVDFIIQSGPPSNPPIGRVPD